jgi:cell division GTPase FtsZ
MTTRTITAVTYEDLRDSLATSGIFDMTDCAVEIWCPERSEVEEVQRMVTLIESMVHVTDVKIGSAIEDLTSDEYRVIFIEDSNKLRKKYIR